jgi:Uri superfamily endonuclease
VPFQPLVLDSTYVAVRLRGFPSSLISTMGNDSAPMRALSASSSSNTGNGIVFIGGSTPGGTYVLRIRVHRSLTMAFGRFKGGKRIRVQAGDFLYFGSALAQKGASSLARRLVRHATRTDNRHPHPIRQAMLVEFERIGLGCNDLRPVKGKHLRWNVDHLLDQPCATLVTAYLIRTPLRLEGDLGRLLAGDPAAVIIERGLGANDIKGNTHLVRIEADERWWQRLPGRLRTFRKQKVALANMHPIRRQAIELHLQAGMTFWPRNTHSVTSGV